MTTLLHLSDPHFGTEQAPVVDALVRRVRQLDPAILVLSGDITQRATARQFEAARAFVERLGIPTRLVIPGNHDVPLFDVFTRAVDPYARYRRAFGADLEPVVEDDDWLVIGVKTTRRWRHKHGEVSATQVGRVAARLRRAAPHQVRIVVVHQPVAAPLPEDAGNLLRGRAAAVRAWRAAGADLIACGHIHRPRLVPLLPEHPELTRRTWCLLAGTAVSSRVRPDAGNSFNLLRRAAAGQLTVERWDYREAARDFAPAVRETLTLDRDDASA